MPGGKSRASAGASAGRGKMKDKLPNAMRLIGESADHLQRVHDSLFDDGKETDLELDLECARNRALQAAKLIEVIENDLDKSAKPR
jgi:hypothetical protein